MPEYQWIEKMKNIAKRNIFGFVSFRSGLTIQSKSRRMKLITTLILGTLLISQVYSQEHLEVEGSARIQQDLTVESLAGNGTRNVATDSNGKLIVEGIKMGAVSIPAESFLPIKNDIDYNRLYDFSPIPATSSNTGFRAPIQLPHGVTLDSIVMYYIDESVNNDLSVQLESYDAQSNALLILKNLASSGTPSSSLGFNNRVSISGEFIPKRVVDNTTFTYRLFLSVQGDWEPLINTLAVSNIHIYYTE